MSAQNQTNGASWIAGLLSGFSRKETGLDFVDRERKAAMDKAISNPFPTARTEDWRQVPLRSLTKNSFKASVDTDVNPDDYSGNFFRESDKSRLLLVNGNYHPEQSDVSALDEGVYAGTLAGLPKELHAKAEAAFNKIADYGDDPFTAFNTAVFANTVVVYVPKEVKVEAPLHIVHVTTGNGIFTAPRALIIAERHSEITIVEDFVGDDSDVYFNTAISENLLHEESHVTHVKLQRESLQAFHVGRTAALLGRGSNFNSYTISIGARFFRNEPIARVDAENAHATLDGLVMISGEQFSDTHSTLDHLKANCTSHQLHKVIVHDKAKSVFNGKIFVRKDSQQIDAFQENRNLLLSQDAEVFTKPQLEIFADDVKCSHGATIGQLSEEELFYLMSRGLSEPESSQLLTYGFALEVIENLPIESLRDQLRIEVKRLTTKNTMADSAV